MYLLTKIVQIACVFLNSSVEANNFLCSKSPVEKWRISSINGAWLSGRCSKRLSILVFKIQLSSQRTWHPIKIENIFLGGCNKGLRLKSEYSQELHEITFFRIKHTNTYIHIQ